ncbi:STAS domain-containing protein [Bacillus benzoevorans]|uniref:Anti-anti-sigma factor n=1 Tax=Bacillus benzoevorans TaxID=1456 RepID=A0A7X0LVZ2_9BACI|nr:STAS domain-containing protein [Bacillus benzoevorans]MBB6446143.1 anti-anti-sigma factor [Bacillus benzoevorans]
MDLLISKEVEGTAVLFKIKGILDISTSNIVDKYLEELENITQLIFDFSELSFIDSTGIGSIINAIYLSAEKNFSFQLQGIDELTDQLFETVGLYQILDSIQKEAM